MQLIVKNAKLRERDALTDIAIDRGVILEIGPNLAYPADTVIDAKGALVTPSLIDPHIHLDKVNIFDVVRKNVSGTLKEAIEIIWDKKKDYTTEDILARSEDVLLRALKNGTLNMRSHVDVDTIGGLKPLEGVKALREKYRNVMDLQLVAFPQEGIIKNPGCEALMWKAMESGADVVGGMPANEYSPDDSREHVRICFDIAEKFDADIDMHVDETDDPFYRTLEMIADEALKRGWIGRVTAGHTCALAAYDDHYANYVIEKCAKAQIRFITNPVTNLLLQGRLDKQPIRRGITRVKELLAAGILVSFGQDCVKDTFYPYGSADMLQVANVTAHAAQMSLPPEIETVYDMITTTAAEILKLDNYGLAVGKKANLVVVNAKDARDAIRLTPERLYVIREGKIVAKTVVQTELYL
ncbi:MAG: amidohydrolase family protein [Eubacteriales bacterium]|nr:amidohydrolase family protein [Eubacteriales bacterium]